MKYIDQYIRNGIKMELKLGQIEYKQSDGRYKPTLSLITLKIV